MDRAKKDLVKSAVFKGHNGLKIDYDGGTVLIGHIVKYLPIPSLPVRSKHTRASGYP